MVGHNDRNAKIEFLAIVVQAAVENNRPNLCGKHPAAIGAESDEVRLVINLQMRKLSPIEGLRHQCQCGDSRHWLSAERSSATAA